MYHTVLRGDMFYENMQSHLWFTKMVSIGSLMEKYRKISNISCTLVDNKIVDHSDVVGVSPVGAAPTASSFSVFGKDSRKAVRDSFKCWISASYIRDLTVSQVEN